MGDKYFYVHIKIFVGVASASAVGATATQAASFARSKLGRVA
jgi:hypothetical protein